MPPSHKHWASYAAATRAEPMTVADDDDGGGVMDEG